MTPRALSVQACVKARSSMKVLLQVLLGVVWHASALAVDESASRASLKSVLDSALAARRLDGTVRFFLARGSMPDVAESLGQDVVRARTATTGRSRDKACEWAVLSALVALEHRAKSLGANAVLELSGAGKTASIGSDEVECEAGVFSTMAVLRGTYAKVGN